MATSTAAYRLVHGRSNQLVSDQAPDWLWGRGTPNGDVGAFVDANKGSLYSQVDASDDTAHAWLKVDEGGDDNDWVQLLFTGGTDGLGTTTNLRGKLKVHNHLVTDGYAIEAKSDFTSTTAAHYGITSTAEWEPTGGTATAGGIQGVQGVARLTAAFTVTGGSLIGTYGQVCVDGTVNGGGVMLAGVYSLIEDGGTYTAVSHVASLWVDSHLAQTVSSGNAELVYMTNNGATTLGNAFYIYAGNKITNLFTIDTASGMVSDSTTSDYTFTKTRLIKIVAGGETGYLVMDIP